MKILYDFLSELRPLAEGIRDGAIITACLKYLFGG